ncbi:MAG: hypothetical protein GAK45_02020 [Pseudomonas citronellolis]|nr:MAG: hypothetical protein GAK45_02020 [Pseudomonas citronellolis]
MPPLSFFDSNQQFRGIVADLLERIHGRTGLEFDVRSSASAQDMVREIKRGGAMQSPR